MSEWQPIATAPKDDLVLVYSAEGADIAVFWSDAYDVWVNHQGRMEPQPTHWLRLPAPPTVDEGMTDPARVQSAEGSQGDGSAPDPLSTSFPESQEPGR